MKSRRPKGNWRHWLGLFCLGGAANVAAQNQPADAGFRWMKLRLNEASVGVEAEGNWERRTVPDSGQKTTRESLYFVPTVGLDLVGSIYHPNLFQYEIKSENGVGWQENTLDVKGGGTRSDTLFLQRYQINAEILKEKPFAAGFSAEKDHTTRDYDFFTRATVDREAYGGRAGYTEGPVPFTVSMMHTQEDISGNYRPMSQIDDTLNFSAYNERASGDRTDLAYTLNDYTRQETGAYTQDGTQHTVSLTDHETFGKKEHLRLNSSIQLSQLDTTTATYGQAGSTTRPNNTFTDHEHLNAKHSDTLQSDYNYGYNYQDSGAVKSDGHSGSAALTHRLYESLTSTIDAHGQTYSSRGAGMSLDTTRYGAGLNENYTKKLGEWGRLTIGYGGLFDRENRETMGTTIFVAGEMHTLNDGTVTFLNQPGVNTLSIEVWDAAGAVRYRELLDYLVLPHGERTEIKRVVGGQIPNGGGVRVDYSVVSRPSDSYSTAAHQIQVRMDFFNGMVGIYGHLNLQDNYGGKTLLLENINDKVAGVEFTRKWLRTGAEYELYDSNLSPYRSARLFQNLNFELDPSTTLNLDVGQTWRTFTQVNRDLTTYHFIVRTRFQIHPALALNTEGGMRFQEGEGYDQQLATARANLEYKYGRLTMQTGYEYEDESFLGELRLRHFFFLRARRTF